VSDRVHLEGLEVDGRGGMNWVVLVKDKNWWRAVANALIILRVP